MSTSTQYLNALYRDIADNSPFPTSKELPPEIGEGHIRQIKTKHGVAISDWRMNTAVICMYRASAKTGITAQMEKVLHEMTNSVQYRGGLGHLYMEGKLLEMISVYLASSWGMRMPAATLGCPQPTKRP